MGTVVLPSDSVTDFASFHQVCRDVFGFPDFYGANMNAWSDCLTYLRVGDGMSRFHLGPGEWLDIEVPAAESWHARAFF